MSGDIQAILTGNNVTENNEHDSADNSCGDGKERRDERPDDEKERPPAGIKREINEEDIDEIHTRASEEESKHDMAGDLD
jgi:hypothetical protein